MRIQRLELRAFGPFAGEVLDLERGDQGLHMVYGANEAGKSTALRAIEYALFGIPVQTTDAFRHSYQNLRIGATLCDGQGRTLSFVRRKGSGNTLLGADGLQPLPDAALRPLLAGLEREVFRSMFGIGHDRLVEGGRELARGGGAVGQVLFAAGTGIGNLAGIADRLRRESEELFKPRAQNKRINKALKALEEARRRARQPRVSSDDWDRHERSLREVQAERDRVQGQWQQLSRELHRLERIEQALPVIARRKQLRYDRDRLGAVRILPANFADQRREADAEREFAEKARQAADAELARIDGALARLDVPDALLARATEVRELSDLLGSHRKAERDLPGLRGRREQAEHAAAALLAQLRPGVSLAEAEPLRLTRLEQTAIQDLGNRHEALVQGREQARGEIDQAGRQLDAETAAAAALDAPRDAGPLKQALRQAQAEGDLERTLAQAEALREQGERQAAIDLARLGLWSGRLEELERLAVPSAETIDRFDKDLGELDRRIGLAEAKLRQLGDTRADVGRQAEQARRQGELPSHEDLLAARRLRDLGWQMVLRTLRGDAPDAAELEPFLAPFAGRDLAGAYEESVRAADEISDRLRREADRVAVVANLAAQAEALDGQIETGAGALAALEAERQRVQASWQECWAALGIEPGRPREMRSWLAAQQALMGQAQTLRRQQGEVEQIGQRVSTHRARLGALLAQLGVSAPAGEAFSGLVGRAQSLVERIESTAVRREELEKSIRQLRQRKSDAESRLKRAEGELADWRNRWAIAVEPLGLPAEATPAAANAVLGQMNELFNLLADVQDKADRIEEIRRDADAFAARVGSLARELAPDLAAAAVEVAAEGLLRRLHGGTIAQTERQTLQADRRRRAAEQEKAQRTIDTTSARLGALCREAGCAAAEELPQAERASAEALRLDEALSEHDRQLAGLAAGAALEEFAAEAEAVPADELPARLAELRRQVDELDRRRTELGETIGSERQVLDQMRAGSDTAAAAEDVQELLARLEPDVLEYARLRLALRLLRDGMEQYRAASEGPVLRRAGQLFREFTLSRFEGLRVDEEDGQRILKGVRAREEPVLVDLAAMSDGTADQLYLALRLASLESYLEGREAVPLVVDDVLIRFDDERSAAALRALAALSEKTQVVFFTHHPHLVELARCHVAEDALFVHRLGTMAE